MAGCFLCTGKAFVSLFQVFSPSVSLSPGLDRSLRGHPGHRGMLLSISGLLHISGTYPPCCDKHERPQTPPLHCPSSFQRSFLPDELLEIAQKDLPAPWLGKVFPGGQGVGSRTQVPATARCSPPPTQIQTRPTHLGAARR